MSNLITSQVPSSNLTVNQSRKPNNEQKIQENPVQNTNDKTEVKENIPADLNTGAAKNPSDLPNMYGYPPLNPAIAPDMPVYPPLNPGIAPNMSGYPVPNTPNNPYGAYVFVPDKNLIETPDGKVYQKKGFWTRAGAFAAGFGTIVAFSIPVIIMNFANPKLAQMFAQVNIARSITFQKNMALSLLALGIDVASWTGFCARPLAPGEKPEGTGAKTMAFLKKCTVPLFGAAWLLQNLPAMKTLPDKNSKLYLAGFGALVVLARFAGLKVHDKIAAPKEIA